MGRFWSLCALLLTVLLVIDASDTTNKASKKAHHTSPLLTKSQARTDPFGSEPNLTKSARKSKKVTTLPITNTVESGQSGGKGETPKTTQPSTVVTNPNPSLVVPAVTQKDTTHAPESSSSVSQDKKPPVTNPPTTQSLTVPEKPVLVTPQTSQLDAPKLTQPTTVVINPTLEGKPKPLAQVQGIKVNGDVSQGQGVVATTKTPIQDNPIFDKPALSRLASPAKPLPNIPSPTDQDSDDESDTRLQSYQDMTNLYHSHDSAALPSPFKPRQSTPSLPSPYTQGPISSSIAFKRQQQCTSDLFRVTKEPTVTTEVRFRWNSLTANDVLKRVLSTLPLTTFGKIPETPLNNVDGRLTRPVLGAMGGDPGEFLVALAAFEDITRTQLDSFQTAVFLTDFLLSINKPSFLLPTDTQTLQSLCTDLKFCLPQYRIDNPPREMFHFLRSQLVKPEYIGCSHLKHITQHSEFGVRSVIVSQFLIAFFNLLWGVPENRIAPKTLAYLRSKLRLQVLQGAHTEGAILHVDSSACGSQHPMLVPEYNGVSIALIHDTAVQDNRSVMAQFLVEQAKKMGIQNAETTDEERYLQRMNEIGEIQYQQALFLDEAKVPVFKLVFPAACCGGVVPTM